MRRHRLIDFAILASLPWLVSCQAGFEPPSEVDSLRVLAVRPEPASGAPGETVRLEMLYLDGTPRDTGEQARSVEVAWLGGCHNPPSRLYFDCFSTISSVAERLSNTVSETPPDALPPGTFGVGTTFSLPIPDDILTSAPRAQTDAARFGVSYVFFAACAGELRARPERRDQVPLACVDPATGAERGSNDFVQGFATLFTFEGARNENPELLDIEFDFIEGTPNSIRACPRADECPRLQIYPRISRASAEELPGENAREIVWANFYATDGELEGGTQLVNDRASGWIEDHGVYFRAPPRTGTLEIVVTVHDQRGGTAWGSLLVNVVE